MDGSSTSKANQIKTTKVVYPQVYSYTLPDEPDNEGSQKIGYTERKDVDSRILEQVNTAAKRHRYNKLWSGPAFFNDQPPKDFKDKLFHKFLVKNGIENRLDLGKEWFYFNGTPDKSKELFDTFREQGFAALQQTGEKIPYELRSEQESAINQAIDYFNSHENGEFLWNAKPRFGKTLASYDLAKQLNAQKVLIVTNRPAIANSWFDDFEKFIDGYYFISDTESLADRKSLTREQYNAIDGLEKPMITFLSLQDLKGSKFFGGSHNKLKWVADLEWDLLVIDEAHEGVDTGRTDAAFEIVRRQNTLHLSGTPFKALANQKFAKEAIFNWTYLDEQKAKTIEINDPTIGDSGPHVDLPDLRLYTYRISQMIAAEVNEGVEIDDEVRDYAFDLNEFFATKNQKFIHEEDVREFLRKLSTNSKYPFSTPELRDELRHTFWYVGNRVDSVKALEQLLREDEVFKDYKVVVAAGDGKSFNEEESDFKGNEKSYDKVKKAIAQNPRTITLSCGQLTTGVTVKEWSAVLMLTDIKAPSLYMQAAFRAQNPHRFIENDELKAKKSAYLFDFAPTRVLEIYDDFANALNPKAASGEITESERKDNIKELLNYFPVISEDVDGKMVELDAEKVLTFPNALAATEIVQVRFMTNLLFNDNIKGVFHFPQEVEDILDKMPVEKNKRAESSKQSLDLDEARKIEQSKQTKINENTGVILGEKIYRANIDRVVDNVLDQSTPEETLDMLPEKVEALVEAPIAKLKEQYKLTATETDDLRKETTEKIKLVVSEFEASEEKDPETLKANLASVIEQDLVQAKVEQQETKAVENVQKSKEDEVREHLRAFTRTIPMFVMANSSREVITIDNFDEKISDEDFIDLTNITKEEFHKLRDGFDYTDDNGERQRFEGVFHKYKFNASIAEFVAEKHKRANYFETDEDIFELIPNQKNNQIFTPRKVVKMMVDGLEKGQPELFRRTDSTFIDLYMKSGMYITEIVKKLFTNTRHNYSSDAECLKHILENQVYGLAPTGVLHGITTSYIFGFDTEHNIDMRNFVQHDLLPQAKDGTATTKLAQLFGNGGNMMKFDAVVGNPPYQENDNDSGKGSARPIYNHFMESAIALRPNVLSLITPSVWFTGGKGLDGFRERMLNDRNFSKFTVFSTPKDIFPSANLRGGINYFIWDRQHDNSVDLVKVTEYRNGEIVSDEARPFRVEGTGDIFISDNKALGLLQKLISKGVIINDINSPKMLSSYVSSRNPFGFDTKFRTTDMYHTTKNSLLAPVKIYVKSGISGYIEDKYIQKGRDWIGRWKVITPFANNIGTDLNDDNLNSLIAEPGSIVTETYLIIGANMMLDEQTAQSLRAYLKTKFVRTLISLAKANQNGTRTTYRLVPSQDFGPNSDIHWSKPTTEIDQQLYNKYGLAQEEIDFIESRVKAME